MSDEKQLDFFVDLDGFEGPLDLLLTLAKEQKVDLLEISILDLANQYLSFVNNLSSRDIEVAADLNKNALRSIYVQAHLVD